MTYNFGSSYSTKNWNTQSANPERDRFALFGPANDNALIPEFGCGTDGINSFTLHIKTTAEDNSGTFTRNTAWRKAYRILNRFDVGDINMDRKNIDRSSESQSTYEAKRSFAARRINGFELPFDHKPPCRFPNSNIANPNGGSRPNIELVYSMRPKAVIDPKGEWDGTLDDNPGVEWSIGSTGLKLIENSTPDTIEFTALKTGSAPNQRIDTSTAIIPAYSGEILSFQGDGGGVGYMGTEDGLTKIYINITETDEILRWDSDNDPDFDPHTYWLKTFSSIQVRNDTRRLSGINFKKSTMEVVSKDKNNYVVSFTSSSLIPLSSWGTGDIIRVQFKRKKTILFADNRAPWSGAKYQNIRYRSLDDEFNDDAWVQPAPPSEIPTGACCISPGNCLVLTQQQCIDATGSGSNWAGPNTTVCNDCAEEGGDGEESAEIQPFTLTLNGTLEDGTITINYPSGVNATGITFEVFIER